jgi:flagellar protein FlbD
MITLNRLGHDNEPFHLNADMIVTVEATPDTVITLATGTKIVVSQTPAEVAQAVHEFRASVLAEAFRRRGRPGAAGAAGGIQSPPSPTHEHRESAHLTAVASSPEGKDDPS